MPPGQGGSRRESCPAWALPRQRHRRKSCFLSAILCLESKQPGSSAGLKHGVMAKPGAAQDLPVGLADTKRGQKMAFEYCCEWLLPGHGTLVTE